MCRYTPSDAMTTMSFDPERFPVRMIPFVKRFGANGRNVPPLRSASDAHWK
jgi:hypothetical protein